MALDREGLDCQKCTRRGCLKKSPYVKFKNIPSKNPLYDRTVYIDRKTLWLYYDIISHNVKADMPVIKFIRTFMGICPKSIAIPGINDILRRFFYCKKYPGVPPFPGSYDDQPVEWVEITNIIDDEIARLSQQESNV